ncbi:MAG: small subunit ribosomal protein S16 [Parcubacteria group bacterium Gr01-1014_8]|nr:MAG: small subunit ribosomal protein S16 [Parcubacteria group bacterium Gr01-1014_8]
MLKIRFQRTGRTNDASFRLIVVEHTEPAKTGDFLERVGTYDPKSKVKNLDADRIKYWLSKGAKASPTVHNLLISAGIISGKKINVLPKKNPPKKEEVAAAEGAAPSSEAAEASAVAAAAETANGEAIVA